MPIKDVYHDVVKNALIKDGWTITDDPLYIDMGEAITLYVDLGAEKLIGAQKGNREIAVEVKSFTQVSVIYELHQAVGQFISYRLALRRRSPTRVLYLAVPNTIYDGIFSTRFGQEIIAETQLKMLVYDIREEKIVQWIEQNDTVQR
jgi:hypothetical protein